MLSKDEQFRILNHGLLKTLPWGEYSEYSRYLR